MASQISKFAESHKAGKWRARVKHQYIEYFLGYYNTREEAEGEEETFREFISQPTVYSHVVE